MLPLLGVSFFRDFKKAQMVGVPTNSFEIGYLLCQLNDIIFYTNVLFRNLEIVPGSSPSRIPQSIPHTLAHSGTCIHKPVTKF